MSNYEARQNAEIASLEEFPCVPDAHLRLRLMLCPEFMTVSGGLK
jgi:hypothetical protein